MNHFAIDWNWKALDLKICFPILLTLVFFSIYWFTSKSEKIKRIFYNKYDYDQASLKHIFFTKYFGFFTMGILPTFLILIVLPELTLADLGFTLIYETSLFSLLWILGLYFDYSIGLFLCSEAKKLGKLPSNKSQSLV